MRQLLDHAADNGYGIPAFNVNNLEQVQAVMSAADEVGAPVILQASAGARKYAGEPFIKHLILAALEAYPKIPLVMHQDHGQSPDVCQGAIDLGFTSVMMDGSLQADGKTIASYDYNVDVTKKVVELAHRQGVTVEGELGCLGSLETMRGDKEDGHGTEATMTRDQLLTDPEQAADFVKRTQLDALAIAIGTSHGAYKFSRKPTGDILAIGRSRRSTSASEHAPGDARLVERAAGPAWRRSASTAARMKETYGVPVAEIQEAIKHGVRKINIDTDIRLAMTGAIRKFFAEHPDKFDPREYLKAGARGGQAGLQAALRAVRLRWTGDQDQGPRRLPVYATRVCQGPIGPAGDRLKSRAILTTGALAERPFSFMFAGQRSLQWGRDSRTLGASAPGADRT
jgi:fructose-bisphosphate aldolase class II